MIRDWIDEGLRNTRERANQQQLASEHRHHQTAVIKAKGPELMRAVVAAVGAAVEEFRHKAQSGRNEIEFEALPHEGFCVTKTTLPKVGLECRPEYETHVLCCNMTRVGDQETDTVEWVFSLDFTVDESNNVALRHGSGVLHSADEAVEFLLKPVLFPLPA
ncbi:MAG: hypothetical protein HYZ89_02515 [Candidatus Omnitrophica bacterium]|nr:hypothetical protein [Candidatus Omnitrophota bacterium]